MTVEPDVIDRQGTMRVDGMILYMRERGSSPEATARALGLPAGVVRYRIRHMREILAERQGDIREGIWPRLKARFVRRHR